MEVRDLEPGELTNGALWTRRAVSEHGGTISVSQFGPDAMVHDLIGADGHPSENTALMFWARGEVKSRGFDSLLFYARPETPDVAQLLIGHGATLEYTMYKLEV